MIMIMNELSLKAPNQKNSERTFVKSIFFLNYIIFSKKI